MTTMNLMASLRNHAGIVKRAEHWQQQRVPSRDAESTDTRRTEQNTEPMTQHQRMAEFLQESKEENRRAMAVLALEGRMLSGGRLSSDELSFLRENAPHLYEKAVRVAHERREFERQLENARSKREVADIHHRAMTQFAAEAGNVARSGLPRAERESAMKAIQMRMAAIQNEHARFVQSERYQALPDDDDRDGVTFTITISENTEDPVRYLDNLFARYSDSVSVLEDSEVVHFSIEA